MSPEQARELRHELRTPVNHLIGYAELLLEEAGISVGNTSHLESIRTVARQVLELVPVLLGDSIPDPAGNTGAKLSGTSPTSPPASSENPQSIPSRSKANPSSGSAGNASSLHTSPIADSAANTQAVSALKNYVAQLRESAEALTASPDDLPTDDLARLSSAASRLGELAERLTAGPVLVDRQTGSTAAPMTGRLETILVVDDDEANRDVLGRRLQKLGYGIVEARDGIEALERLAEPQLGIDLVLLDVMMPRLDGFAVLERHRDDPAIRHIPVIMISALDDMASIVRCIEAGAEDYLPKPFDPVLLKARVGACMDKKRLRDAERQLHATVATQAAELLAWNTELEQRVAQQVQEVERLNLMQRFVPPQLVEVLAAGGVELLKSHRRDITALFCDLRGFTSFAERSEPEDVMAVLAEMHNAVGPLIFEQGGTLSQFTGDGMMVFFNDPIPCDDPARRAVTLAIGMRERVAVLSEQWKARGHHLTLGVGIAAGYATCGQIGFEGRFEYTAIGSVVNLAARLCGEAKGGEVLVSERIVSMLSTSLQSQRLADVELKGLAKPVPTYLALTLSN